MKWRSESGVLYDRRIFIKLKGKILQDCYKSSYAVMLYVIEC